MVKTIEEYENDGNEAEQALISACCKGRSCILNSGKLPQAGAKDAPTVQADLIRLLAVEATSLHEKGVWLEGAVITGQVDLSFAKCRGRLVLDNCRFAKKPLMAQAKLAQLSMEGSHLPGLFAQGLKVEGDIFLRDMTAKGTVILGGAQFGGQLDCEGAKLNGKGGEALNAQEARVAENVFLRGVTAVGTVNVSGAEIGGQLDCERARLNGNGGKALHAQRLRVTADIFLRNVQATGTVDVNGSKIGGQLSCTGAALDGNESEALNAQAAQVTEDVVFGDVCAKGTVDVSGAKIGGQLDCEQAELNGEGGRALNAQSMKVNEGFYFRKLKVVSGRIVLSSAHVCDLADDVASWEKCSDLLLDGFTYDRVGGPSAPKTFAARKTWLARGSRFRGEFRPQPYTQFAKVMRAAGHLAEARKALMERDRLLAIEARLAEYKRPEDGRYLFPLEKPWADAQYVARWAWDSLLRLVAGYGYAPVRSLGALGILFLIAFGVAHMTWSEGQFAPNSDVILVSQGWQDLLAKDCLPKPTSRDCIKNPAETWANDPAHGMDWDSFNALGYAADLVIPILDLGQDSAWAPSKDRGPWGAGLWWGRWVFAALGWLVTALGAAAVTGIIQRNAPD